MPYELYIRHYDRAGVLKSAYIEPLWARYTASVDGQEPLVFAIDTENPAVAILDEFDILEVLIRNKEIGLTNFTRSFVGILRGFDISTDSEGKTFITFTAPNEKHILSWRSILWPANVANRTMFTAVKAETVMKTLVQYNCTGAASVVNGRHRAGDLFPGMGLDITNAVDAGGGNALTFNVMGDNLLAALQKIREQAGGDFSFEWQGSNDFEFGFHVGQLGSDKSSGTDRVLFSVLTMTMGAPRLVITPAGATTTIVGGQGENSDRAVSAVNGPDYAADNDIEVFTDARNESTADGRIYRGTLKLDTMKAVSALSFDVLQTSNQFYSPIAVAGKKTYNVGDLVMASYFGDSVMKIDSVLVDWNESSSDSPFKVSVTMETV